MGVLLRILFSDAPKLQIRALLESVKSQQRVNLTLLIFLLDLDLDLDLVKWIYGMVWFQITFVDHGSKTPYYR